jgi:UDP:flavonoid glycosyltransferase YjiC (YdhE family)
MVSLPFAGHVAPTAAVAGELVRRGHEVVAYTGAKYRQRFAAAGAGWLPWTEATDFDDADLAATFPRIGDGKGLRGGRANGEHILFGTAPGQLADLMAAEPFDLMVTDQLAWGAGIAAEARGVPSATVAVTPLSMTSRDVPPVGMPWGPATGRLGRARDAAVRGVIRMVAGRVMDSRLNRMRASVGLGPVAPRRLLDATYSPHLVLAQGVPGLDFPRGDLPPHVHYIGRLAAPVPASEEVLLPVWWPDLAAARAAGRPVVHVTQGTLDVDPDDLLRPALAGLADQDVVVVGTTGGAPPSSAGPLPGNARMASFLPHDHLLPLVDVMITNGGWGGVLASIEAGVPLIVAGGSLDKPEVGRRVAWSGAGLDLRTGRPGAVRIRRAVHEVRSRPEMGLRAAELGAALRAAGGAERAADLIEGAATPTVDR